jgi:alpha-glucosidase
MASKNWRDVNAIYQIYPRSFQDSNDDGVGDLRGVINRLEYINGHKDSLGIDAIWFSPIFTSPMADMGYDVSDYCDIDPLFGTLEDFKELIAKAHENNINVMIDFVPNHTSDQHP